VANIKSQIKRNKQNEKRHQRNKAVKAVSKGVIHKNQAANRKSAIMKKAASL
jgi:small subunit ribosomal protein S20